MATENTQLCGCTLVLRPSITQLGGADGGNITVELGLEGSKLRATIGSTEASVDLSTLAAQTTVDRFVRSGRFDEATKSLILVTATADGDEQEVSVDMAQVFALLTTVQGDKGDTGEKGDKGDTITVAGYDTTAEGTTIRFSDGSEVLIPASSAGSSSTDLSALPTKAYQNGSKIVALDANGQPYVVAQNTPVFNDVAVDISLVSSAYNEGKTRSVVNVKVTNVKAEAVSGVSYVFACGDTVSGDATSQTLDLEEYGEVSFTYTIEHEENTYVNATVSVEGDTDTHNNSRTLSIAAKTAVSDTTINNVFTEECPMATGYVVGYEDTPLIFRGQTDTIRSKTHYENTNVIKRENLKDLQIKFTNVSSVVVMTGDTYTSFCEQKYGPYLYKRNEDNTIVESSIVGTDASLNETASPSLYSFDPETGLFTFGGDFNRPYACIFLRTKNGDKCQYQSVWINANTIEAVVRETKDTYTVEGLLEDQYHISTISADNVETATRRWSDEPVSVALEAFTDFKVNAIGFGDLSGYRMFNDDDAHRGYYQQVRPEVFDCNEYTDEQSYHDIKINSTDRLDIQLGKGEVQSFTITGNNAGIPEMSGDITITRTAPNKLSVKTTYGVSATNNVIGNRISISFV